MKKLIAPFFAAAFVLITALLAACATPPTDAQVQRIQLACAVDAGIRPSITALMVFATPQESAGIVAARAVIDPICANPGGTVQANAIAAFTAATTQVVSIYSDMKTRKAAVAPQQ